MLDLLEVVERDEARDVGVTEFVLATPEWMYALPLHSDEEDVLAEERSIRLFVDLLVGQQEPKSINDKGVPLAVRFSARHDDGLLFVIVQEVLPDELITQWACTRLHRIVLCLVLVIEASYE